MRKITLLMLSLFLSGIAIAADNAPRKGISHKVILKGMQRGEGRFILATEYINNKLKGGSYFCATKNARVYDEDSFLPPSQTPFHEEHLIKFSICQDETLAECQEFAVDKYTTFRNLDGYLENDVNRATVNVAPFKADFKACEPNAEMDELVIKAKSISDRRFAHVG